MNNKLLLCSILSVVILILVSFTSVVGYKRVESDMKISPLFIIRSKKATGKESRDITCDYVGKKEESILSIPKRASETSRIQKTISIISKMDDKAFSKFVARIILNLKYQEQMTDKETLAALKAFNYIRNNPNDMKYYGTNELSRVETLHYISCHFPYFLGCRIYQIIHDMIIIILLVIVGWMRDQTLHIVCNTMQYPR